MASTNKVKGTHPARARYVTEGHKATNKKRKQARHEKKLAYYKSETYKEKFKIRQKAKAIARDGAIKHVIVDIKE